MGFFRCSELPSNKASDVNIFPSPVSIFLDTSKTDQDSPSVLVGCCPLWTIDTCPVKALEQ